MKSGADGAQLIAPAASVPTPTTISAAGPDGRPSTAPQSVRATRWPSTSSENAPNRYADQRQHHRSAPIPSPDTRNVPPTKSSSARTDGSTPGRTPDSRSTTVSRAYAPVTAFTASQPQRATQITAPGSRFPRCPNTARDSAMPGAPPRFPAIETSPTIPYDTTGAAAATTSTCQKFSPCSTTRPAPMVRSRTEMFAATHVGNSSRTRPTRAESGTGSSPRLSYIPRRIP